MYAAQGSYEDIYWKEGWIPRFEMGRVYTYDCAFSAPDADGNATNTIFVDGLKVWNKTKPAVDTGVNIYAFACNKGNAPTAWGKVRCYGPETGPVTSGLAILVR